MNTLVTIRLQISLSKLALILKSGVGLFFLSGVFIPVEIQIADAASLVIEQNTKNVSAEQAPTELTNTNFLPLIISKWPPALPAVPTLNPIQNADGDNYYEVIWSTVPNADTYTLQVATKQDFSDAVVAYEGPNIFLPYTQGQSPCSYFYRVRASNEGGSSEWSATQSINIFPLHVGLNLRWDGTALIKMDNSEEIGTHDTFYFDKMMDTDKIRNTRRRWYDPNPEGWSEENVYAYYSVSTGNLISTTAEDDPDIKWFHSWRLAYGASFKDGQTVNIDGQPFTVHGPIYGQTSLGYITYWEFTNQADIIHIDDGEGITFVIHPGKAILRYDTGPYGLEIFSDVTDSVYLYEIPWRWTMQYINNLTSMSTSPASQQAFNITAYRSEEEDNRETVIYSFLRPIFEKK